MIDQIRKKNLYSENLINFLSFDKDERPDFKELEKIMIYDFNGPKQYFIKTDIEKVKFTSTSVLKKLDLIEET